MARLSRYRRFHAISLSYLRKIKTLFRIIFFTILRRMKISFFFYFKIREFIFGDICLSVRTLPTLIGTARQVYSASFAEISKVHGLETYLIWKSNLWRVFFWTLKFVFRVVENGVESRDISRGNTTATYWFFSRNSIKYTSQICPLASILDQTQ